MRVKRQSRAMEESRERWQSSEKRTKTLRCCNLNIQKQSFPVKQKGILLVRAALNYVLEIVQLTIPNV